MIELYEKAGKIAYEVSLEAKKEVKVGMKLIELAEKIENSIRVRGAKPAFPVNISINECAAHFTPSADCKDIIGEKDLVKIDIGAMVDGFIGDIAFTVDFSGENGKLIEASERALEIALSLIKNGARTSEIGYRISEEIKKYGFKPIENLTGHSLGEYNLHAGIEIPNIQTPYSKELKEGDVLAIEPFATNGAGRVGEGVFVEIFSFLEPCPVRMRESRRVLNYVQENYKKLPFAERWLTKNFSSKLLLQAALRELTMAGVLKQYPVLKEVEKGLVAQSELTVVVEKDAARVLTK